MCCFLCVCVQPQLSGHVNGPNSMPCKAVNSDQGQYAKLEAAPTSGPQSLPPATAATATAQPLPHPETPLDPAVSDFLQQVSLLADKYWNGAQSLLKSDRFKGKILMPVKSEVVM